MHVTNHLTALTAGVARGDQAARSTLKEELGPQLEIMVRRALRVGKPDNLIARHALAEASAVTGDPRQPKFDSPDHLIRLVAGRLLSRVLENAASAVCGVPC
jgi:hypothetical protein